MARIVVSARSAITSIPVASGTVISSYTSGARMGRLSKPYVMGSLAMMVAAISLGT